MIVGMVPYTSLHIVITILLGAGILRNNLGKRGRDKQLMNGENAGWSISPTITYLPIPAAVCVKRTHLLQRECCRSRQYKSAARRMLVEASQIRKEECSFCMVCATIIRYDINVLTSVSGALVSLSLRSNWRSFQRYPVVPMLALVRLNRDIIVGKILIRKDFAPHSKYRRADRDP